MQALFLGVGALQVGLGAFLAAGMVPPNRFVGYRTARTLADPVIWYAVNARLGWALLASGVVAVAATLVIFALTGPERTVTLTGTVVGIAALLAVLFASFR